MSENILPRVTGPYLAAAVNSLPAPESVIVDTMEATIDVPGIGTVRVTAKRMKAKRGKVSRYFWTPTKAVVEQCITPPESARDPPAGT